MEENANKLHFCHLKRCYLSTNFDIFGVQNSEFFPMMIANKIFYVTVLLLVYFHLGLQINQLTQRLTRNTLIAINF